MDHTMTSSRFATAADAVAYILAGRARVTLVSIKTGTRFTYKVSQPTEHGPHFVSLLTGQNNDADFTFLGTIFEGKTYRAGKKSTIGSEAPSAVAFAWAWKMFSHNVLPSSLEVWHEGTCGKCGRALTVPSSIASGIGPVCGEKVAA
jgi:Family of unknown function (DUF6011)